MRTIKKSLIAFALLVILAYFVKNDIVNMSLVSKCFNAIKNVIQSEECKQVVSDVKDFTVELVKNLYNEVEHLMSKNNKPLIEIEYVGIVDTSTIQVAIADGQYNLPLGSIELYEESIEDANAFIKELLSSSNNCLYVQYESAAAYLWTKRDIDTENISDISNYQLNAILLNNGYAIEK